MELKFINYGYKNNDVSFTIPSKAIIGLTGSGIEEFIPILTLKALNKGKLTVDNIQVTKENLELFRQKIAYIPLISPVSSELNVYNYMTEYLKTYNITSKDSHKKIKDSLKLVGLPETILVKSPNVLSTSERKLIDLALALFSNPEILVLEEPFKSLDKYNEKMLSMLLQRLKEQLGKTIIIVSSNSNILYKYTTEMLFLKNDQIFLTGPTDSTYLRVDYLKRNKFEIPDSIEFTYLAKKKKEVKIDYHKDVRDVIKDIYKHI